MVKLCLTLLFSLLCSALACVDQASNSDPMPGGWFERNLDENVGKDTSVLLRAVEFAQLALDTAINEDENLSQWKGQLPNVEENDIERVWTQVVAGTNYCIQFSVQRGNSFHKLNCEAKVFKPLPVFEADGSQQTTVSYANCA